MFFFLLWPLFARAPRRWLKSFCCRPRCAKFFFCCAPLGAATFWRGQSKKKTPPRVFFFAPAPGKGRARRSPVGRRHGARAKKKHHPGCFFFFAAAPAKGKGRRSPVGPGPEQVSFFALAPCRRPTGLLLALPFLGAGAKKNTLGGVFFCSGPVPAPNGASPSLAFRRGRSKKNTLGGVFFFALAPCRHGASPSPAFPRGRSKKKTPWVVFFFCCGPARTLTHSLRAWVAMPPPRRGGVFFFAAAPRPDRGGVFFFGVAPPGRSLTHCGLGRFRQGPGGVFFFCCGPAGSF